MAVSPTSGFLAAKFPAAVEDKEEAAAAAAATAVAAAAVAVPTFPLPIGAKVTLRKNFLTIFIEMNGYLI